jgi:hypothetical protein
MERIALNIPYDMPDDKWLIIDAIYKSMPGWQGYIGNGCPVWEIGAGQTVTASVEPSGLCIEGGSPETDISEWVATFIKHATDKLGFTVKDAEE